MSEFCTDKLKSAFFTRRRIQRAYEDVKAGLKKEVCVCKYGVCCTEEKTCGKTEGERGMFVYG